MTSFSHNNNEFKADSNSVQLNVGKGKSQNFGAGMYWSNVEARDIYVELNVCLAKDQP